MRQIRIDDARKRARLKRGGPGVRGGAGVSPASHQGTQGRSDEGQEPPASVLSPANGAARAALPIESVAAAEQDASELLALDEALKKLEARDARKAEIVMLRFFAGLTRDETAAAMELSPRTIDGEWRFAKAWLHRQLAGE